MNESKEDQITGLNNEIDNLKYIIAHLEAQDKNRLDEISVLQIKIDELESQIKIK